MTDKELSSSSIVASRRTILITELNDDDILLGRGTGARKFIGNQRFRSLVAEYKEAYNTAPKNKEKDKIATELFNHIQLLGGRFLKLAETETRVKDIVNQGVWYEVEESIALEKCKQALRDGWEQQGSSNGTNGGLKGGEDTSRERNTTSLSGMGIGVAVDPASLTGRCVLRLPSSLPSHMVPIPPSTMDGHTGSFGGDMHGLLFQASASAQFTFQQQAATPQSMATNPVNPSHFDSIVQNQIGVRILPDAYPPTDCMSQRKLQDLYGFYQQHATRVQTMPANPVIPFHFNASVQNQCGVWALPYAYPYMGSMSHQLLRDTCESVNSDAIANLRRYLSDSELQSLSYSELQGRSWWQTDSVSAEDGQSSRHSIPAGHAVVDQMDCSFTMATSSPSMPEADVTSEAGEVDMLDFLLPVCELDSGAPKFAEEQEEIERATMTDEEKAAALSDLFGRSCAFSTHRKKRAKLDLDKNSVEFLVQQMRMELERIPNDEKPALMEAQTKCSADEFSDARLERFLRCEGMNVKLGAHRFVNYWEGRREAFGPDKFLLPMTLSEALRDDLVALETCICRMLPRLDASGRQLLLWEPCRHTRKGYTSESMLRAVWYLMEVASQQNTDIHSGLVMIVWKKESTIWDFDQKLTERYTYLDRACWPVKRISCHVFCYSPWVTHNVIKPILCALMGKHTRSRHKFHENVPENQLVDVFSDYGILKDMLPTHMGGTLRLDQAEWIANRRAAELREF